VGFQNTIDSSFVAKKQLMIPLPYRQLTLDTSCDLLTSFRRYFCGIPRPPSAVKGSLHGVWLIDLQERAFHHTLSTQKSSSLPNRSTQGGTVMEKWICTVCGYVYDPAIGDSTQEINPGVKFEDLPASWVCPDCGAAKDLFEKA